MLILILPQLVLAYLHLICLALRVTIGFKEFLTFTYKIEIKKKKAKKGHTPLHTRFYNLIPRVSHLPDPSLAPEGGKMTDPGSEVDA